MCSFVEGNDILLSNVSSACITEQVFQKMLGLLRIEEAYKWNLLEKSAKVKNWSPQEREIEKICNSLTSQPTPAPSHLQAWDLLLCCLLFSSCPEEKARSYILWWPMPLRATWSCFISCCATKTGYARELGGVTNWKESKENSMLTGLCFHLSVVVSWSLSEDNSARHFTLFSWCSMENPSNHGFRSF